jgi:glycosyltransferase involved in cell wall biosynthesis
MQPDDRPNFRVLVSGHLPPPFGGIATYYQALMSSSLPDRIHLRFVQTSSQTRSFTDAGRVTLANIISAWSDCLRFLKAVRSYQPDIAHIATASGSSFIKHSVCVLMARFFGCHVILHPHCSYKALYANRGKSWQWFFRWVMRRTDGVITLSKEWFQLKSILPNCEVHYLPNAINIKQYAKIAVDHLENDYADRPIKIFYLGYLGRMKGIVDLVDAIGDLNSSIGEISLDLVGGELMKGELEIIRERIRSKHLDQIVQIYPPAFGDEKLTFFHKADIFVYPSYDEGMPMAIIEAMASGLPIIATNVGGIPDLVKDEVNGLLVEPGRPDQISAALKRLCTEQDLNLSMRGESVRLAAEQYNIELRLPQLINIYQTTLG